MSNAAEAAGPRPKYKRSIKNYLIDSRFQLKYTAMIISVALVISGVMGVFLYRTSSQVTAQSQKVIAQGQKLIKQNQTNNELVKTQIRQNYADTPELAAEFNRAAKEQDDEIRNNQQQLFDRQQETIAQQQRMLWSLVGGLLGLVVLIGLLGIYFTHKVAGPIYKMKLLLGQVGTGKLNFQGKLRKGDELQDFFEAFQSMVDKLKERQAREVEDLDAALAAATSSGASDEAISKIKSVRDEMRAALDK